MATTTKEGGSSEVSSVPAFDTRGYVRVLTRAGVEARHADAQADALEGALRGVATKEDIRVLEIKMEVQFKAIFQMLQAHQEQMRGLRQTMIVGFSVIGSVAVAAMTAMVTLLFMMAG